MPSPRSPKPFGEFVKTTRKGLPGGLFLLVHAQNPKDKMFVRIVGSDKKGHIEFYTLRIYPEFQVSRTIVTIKQFTERFKSYYDTWVGYENDEEWKKFLDSAYFQYLYQKLV